MYGIVIAGPTGVGKSSLSIKLAKKLNLDIISADSMQIYKHMDIGTAKIKETERSGIKHHMLDIVDPGQIFSVGAYEERVNNILTSLEKDKKNIMLVGGTGLYINSVRRGFSELPESEIDLRKDLEKKTNEQNHMDLKKLDPKSAEEIHMNNGKRVIRALEVCLLSGEKFSVLKSQNIKNNNYKFYTYALTRDRENLYERIDKRVELMFDEGLLEEVEFIYKNYKSLATARQAIGYKEIFDYFENKISLEEAKNMIKQNSRNYAKRQLTWFRNDKNIKWFNLDEINEAEIIKNILDEVKK